VFYFSLQLLSEIFILQRTCFVFPLQLLSETFILEGTCIICFHNFCPEHSFYRERVLFFLCNFCPKHSFHRELFYFPLQLLSETFILQGTCFIFFCNFCPKNSFYRERILFSSATSVRKIHSTGNVFFFLPELQSETFILKGTCVIFLHNFCLKHSYYKETVSFFLQLMSAILFTTVHIQWITLRIRSENHAGPRVLPALLPDIN
jgi:hypothetical protein